MMSVDSRSPGRLAWICAILLVLVSAGTSFRALPQAKPSDVPSRSVGPFVRSVDVSVTNIDVIVTDSKGNHASGLKKEDFQVVEDGLEQVVTNFYAVEEGVVKILGDEEIPPPPTPVPGAVVAPAVAAPKTRIVIFVDNLNLQPFNRNRILRNVEAFCREQIKGDVEAMIVTWNRSLKIRRKFTNDGRDLADVLKQIEEESALRTTALSERRDVIQYIDGSSSADQAVSRVRQYANSLKNDLDFTVEALKTSINQLSGVEGRKILLHVSEGLPQSPAAELWNYIQDKYRGTIVSSNMFEFDKTSGFLGVIQAANAAGVTIYPVDASGLEVDSRVTAESRSTQQQLDTFTDRNNLQSMLHLMAEETGGKAILNRNDITIPLEQIRKDYTSYYSLGYRSTRSGADRPHKVDVKVRKKGLVARARRSYMEKSPETKVTEAVISALYFPRDDNPLAAGLEIGKATPTDDFNFKVPIEIRVPYSRLAMLPEGAKVRGRVVFYFIVVDSLEKKSDLTTQTQIIEVDAKAFPQLAKKDFIYTVTLIMIPGNQRLSLAIRDEITNTTSYLQKSVFVSAFSGQDTPPSKK
jgi:VWFA-related protein